MKNKLVKRFVFAGICVACVMAAATLYAVYFNDSRLVVPTDFDTFVMTPRDVPMALAITLAMLYVFSLLGAIICRSARQRSHSHQARTTRRISPRLGWLGLFGLLGFGGFATFRMDGSLFPFCFFAFFGFFSFFFEGRMSGTLMDERYMENAVRAQRTAYNAGMTALVLLLVFLSQGMLMGSYAYTLIAAIIAIALIVALVMVLNAYLLWRIDQGDREDLGDADDVPQSEPRRREG